MLATSAAPKVGLGSIIFSVGRVYARPSSGCVAPGDDGRIDALEESESARDCALANGGRKVRPANPPQQSISPRIFMSRPAFLRRSVLILRVSATCQKKNDNAEAQPAGPQWTRCRRFPAAFSNLIARWRSLRPVAASPQPPACLRLRQSGAARAQNQSVDFSIAIGNPSSPKEKTRARTRRRPLCLTGVRHSQSATTYCHRKRRRGGMNASRLQT